VRKILLDFAKTIAINALKFNSKAQSLLSISCGSIYSTMMIRSHSTSFNMCARLGRFPRPAKNYTHFKNQYALGSHYSVLVSSSSLSTCTRRALRLTKVPMLRTPKLAQPVRGIKTHTGNQGKSRRQRMFALLAKGVKIVRIPFIVLSVFGLGYNHGMMEYARNPEKQEVRNVEQVEVFQMDL